MTTTRMLPSYRPMHHVHPPGLASSSVSTVKCIGKTSGLGGEKMVSSGDCDKKKPKIAVKASVATTKSLITAEQVVDRGLIDLASLLAIVGNALVKVLRPAVKRRQWKLQAQMLLEKAVLDCRFFTLLAVGGSLLSSVLCFVEGCFLILESYFHYFSSLSHSSDQGHIVQLLIEAIDMYLVGTAMLIFGVGLYAIFVGSKGSKGNGQWLPESNLFGLFYLKTLPTWVQVESVSQAKSRIGHAVMMILQVGLLEKFKNIPVVTSLDLACFAGAIMFSSACIFLLLKLSVGGIAGDSR
ncbi:uncharacterized protein LOC8260922 isoform X1 [Ricinus communis]|uniref:Uncharacterized protein n=1 Tax=Ricinus communis TaxID=3988 RepID=B9R7N0_RICCO|nr:uncharacterized protein LOC8260922 isoform X1 [Ricinus communis]EEF52510.1 conserved hypothetical protein [Ricinus communis]|eukprot:XP_002510323.1 uncharacterized protein LOC8260922 [Ricinus communis]